EPEGQSLAAVGPRAGHRSLDVLPEGRFPELEQDELPVRDEKLPGSRCIHGADPADPLDTAGQDGGDERCARRAAPRAEQLLFAAREGAQLDFSVDGSRLVDEAAREEGQHRLVYVSAASTTEASRCQPSFSSLIVVIITA